MITAAHILVDGLTVAAAIVAFFAVAAAVEFGLGAALSQYYTWRAARRRARRAGYLPLYLREEDR